MYNDGMLLLPEKQIMSASLALAQAFQHDPLFIYVFPAQAARQQLTRHIFELQIRQGLLVAGTFTTSAKTEGVIITLPSEKIGLDFRALLKVRAGSLLRHIPLGTLARMARVDRELSALRKRNAPQHYVYLTLLGVQPAFQGQGHAGRLLKTLLSGLDAGGKTCYLETENQRNVSFYQAFGFRLLEKADLADGVPCWAMLRD